MEAHLKILGGPLSGQIIPIPAGELIIGRDEDCQLRPPSDFISRHHCILLLEDDALRIRDLGSKNGTFVNSRHVGSRATILSDGDFVAVGEMVCQISLVSVAAPGSPVGHPGASRPALDGTGVFEGDTLQAESPNVEPTPAPQTASPPPEGERLVDRR